MTKFVLTIKVIENEIIIKKCKREKKLKNSRSSSAFGNRSSVDK